MNFQECLNEVLKKEGGYVNDPNDSGGETNYGITKNVAVSFGYNGNMKTIPMDIVAQIYKKKYWDALRLDDISVLFPKTAKKII